MGLFDYIEVADPRFVCSEGHNLAREEFQSKDFGCDLTLIQIDAAGVVHLPDPPRRPLCGSYVVYATCSQCPAFVQDNTDNLLPYFVEFELELVDEVVRSIQRMSPSTATWIAAMTLKKGYRGPMPYEEARLLHADGTRRALGLPPR